MNISIIHPSRQRPELAAETARKWLNNASDISNIEYLLSLDDSDNLESYMNAFEQLSNRVIIYQSPNTTAIEAINRVAAVSSGNLLVVISDDFECPPNWDAELLKALEGKEDYLVKTYDNIQPKLITLPIMDRAYYNRFGYVYYPEYKHMFCDTEMTDVGHLLGRVITLPIVFPHRHYSVPTGIPRDEVSIKNDGTWTQGETLYKARKRNNFGLKKAKPYAQ